LTLKASADKISGQWDIALRDLDVAIGLDTDNDNAVTWKELRNQHDTVREHTQLRQLAAQLDKK